MKHMDLRVVLDISGDAKNSAGMRKNLMSDFCIVASWGAKVSRSGTLTLQVSNDAFFRESVAGNENNLQEIIDNSSEKSAATWVDLPGSDKTVGAGADSHVWNVDGLHAAAVRIKWSGTGGGGTDNLTAYVHMLGNS